MKKLLLSIVSAFLLFALSAQVSEDFSDYTVGGKLAQQAHAMGRDYWNTWDLNPGGSQDAVIDEMGGNKVLKVTSVNSSNFHDPILRLGDKVGTTWNPKTTGAWELTFKIFIPAGKDGYFNIKNTFPSTVSETWAMQIYMGTDEAPVQGQPGPATPGVGKVYGGSETGVNFNFSHDTWVPIKIFIDLDNDVAEFHVNNNLVHTYQYSKGSFGQSNHRFIAAFNIFPPNYMSSPMTSLFYIDDVVFSSPSGPEILHENNFDNYPAGSYVALSCPEWWTTWNNDPGTNDDALITTEQASSPPHSAKIEWVSGASRGTDIVFKAGDKTTGAYTIDFEMYIPNNQRAYFNILHFFAGTGSEWALGVYFNNSGSGGGPAGTNIRHNNQNTPFTFPWATWFPVKILVDLDNNEANIKINGVDLLTWEFSIKETGGQGLRQLGSVSFWPLQANSVYYLDNFVYATAGEDNFPIIEVTPPELSVMIVPGATATRTITVANTGTSMGEYSSLIEFDFVPEEGTQNFTLSHCIQHREDGLGYENEVLLELGAKFSGSQLCGMVGTYITKMSYYLPQDVGNSNRLTFRVYGPDKANNPGEILAEFVRNNAVIGWNEITFSTPILINTNEIWISVEFLQPAGAFPIGVDFGPLVPGHNFTRRNGGGWSEFTQTEFGNFALRAVAVGKPIPACWLNLSGDTYGNVPKGSQKTFNAVFTATGLEEGVYKANIKVQTNDEENPIVNISCTLTVGSGPLMSVDITVISEAIFIDGATTSVSRPITVSNNGNEPGNYTATIEGTAAWLTLTGDISNITVPAGANKVFNAVLEAAELEPNTYNATIVITTTDEHNPKFEIPCTLVASLGIDDFMIKSVVFPNPANDQVTVQSNAIINSIQVFNNMGQLVHTTNSVNGDHATISVANYAAGIYIMKIHTVEGSQSVKLIVR